MRHARSDYDRIQDPSGKIPAEEPVFLLRAQFGLAVSAARENLVLLGYCVEILGDKIGWG